MQNRLASHWQNTRVRSHFQSHIRVCLLSTQICHGRNFANTIFIFRPFPIVQYSPNHNRGHYVTCYWPSDRDLEFIMAQQLVHWWTWSDATHGRRVTPAKLIHPPGVPIVAIHSIPDGYFTVGLFTSPCVIFSVAAGHLKLKTLSGPSPVLCTPLFQVIVAN